MNFFTVLHEVVHAAVAAHVDEGHVLGREDLRELEIHSEAALHLADLAAYDPETVYVVGCSRQIRANGGDLGDYVRLEHIREHLRELPGDSILATADAWYNPAADCMLRLNIARAVVLAAKGGSPDHLG
jgi:hypothetical protein